MPEQFTLSTGAQYRENFYCDSCIDVGFLSIIRMFTDHLISKILRHSKNL